jgi:hypothetical protein
MAKKPSEVLKKTKKLDKEEKDDKGTKTHKKNGLLDFIARNKKVPTK